MLVVLIIIVLFHGFMLLGRRVGGWVISRLKLYKKILPPKTTIPKSDESLHSATGQLKGFAKYAKLSREITDEYRIFTLKIYLNNVLCVLLVVLGAYYAVHPLTIWVKGNPLRPFVLNPLLTLLILFVVVSLNFFIPYSTFTRLRKGFQFSPAQSLLHDPRKPILYLRSFHYDSPEPSLEVDRLFAGIDHKWGASSEEKLVTALQEIGPVVAVGMPGETLPQLGAVRFYFGDDEWQEKVLELMSLARFVILQAGHSKGTEWEMSVVKNKLQPQQVIFSFVHWQEQSRREAQLDYDIFKMQISRLYGQTLPENIGNSILMWYDSNWTPHLSTANLATTETVAAISEALNTFLNETDKR
jgi:hypothetical protein